MMLLPFDTKEKADERNKFEAFKRGCHPPTIYWWPNPIEHEGQWCLKVGGGEGLTEDELNTCIELENES